MGTFLENYLDVIKGIPTDLYRNFGLCYELDKKIVETIGPSLDRLSSEVLLSDGYGGFGSTSLSRQTSGSKGAGGNNKCDIDIDKLIQIREQQAQVLALHNEKIAIIDESRDIIFSYMQRLDEDLAKFREKIGEAEIDHALADAEASPLQKKPLKHGHRKKLEANMEEDGIGGDSDVEQQGAQDEEEEPELGEDDDQDLRLRDMLQQTSLHPHHHSIGLGHGLESQLSFSAHSVTSTGSGGSGNDDAEPLYCTCRQPSHGEMIACDDEECEFEWFHFACVGMTKQPKGKWYCDDCAKRH